MRNKLNFISEILDLTKSGLLEWETDYKSTNEVHFSTCYEDIEIVYRRMINVNKNLQLIGYSLKCGNDDIVAYKGAFSRNDDEEENKAIVMLNELGTLLDPDIVVPEIKINLIDAAIGRILDWVKRPSVC